MFNLLKKSLPVILSIKWIMALLGAGTETGHFSHLKAPTSRILARIYTSKILIR